MNRKIKDLLRSRCIISYYHHTLKNIYFKAAAGLMTCLKAFDFCHTNLFSPSKPFPWWNFFFYTFIIDSVQKPRFIRGQQMLKKYITSFLNQTYWKQWIRDLTWLFSCTININFNAASIDLDKNVHHISIFRHDTTSVFDNVLYSNINNVCSPIIKSFLEEF